MHVLLVPIVLVEHQHLFIALLVHTKIKSNNRLANRALDASIVL